MVFTIESRKDILILYIRSRFERMKGVVLLILIMTIKSPEFI